MVGLVLALPILFPICLQSANCLLSSLLCLFKEKLTLTDMGILMTAAVCHDLDHPGYNNT